MGHGGDCGCYRSSRHQRPHVAVSGAAKSSWASATEEGEGMTRTLCKREFDAVQALRIGVFSAELREHVLSCVVCTEARGAAEMNAANGFASARRGWTACGQLVWSRAQAQRREIGLRRAARPLVFMRVLSAYTWFVGSVVFALFWRSDFMELLSNWNVLGSESAWVYCCDCAAGDCDWSRVFVARRQALW